MDERPFRDVLCALEQRAQTGSCLTPVVVNELDVLFGSWLLDYFAVNGEESVKTDLDVRGNREIFSGDSSPQNVAAELFTFMRAHGFVAIPEPRRGPGAHRAPAALDPDMPIRFARVSASHIRSGYVWLLVILALHSLIMYLGLSNNRPGDYQTAVLVANIVPIFLASFFSLYRRNVFWGYRRNIWLWLRVGANVCIFFVTMALVAKGILHEMLRSSILHGLLFGYFPGAAYAFASKRKI
jgi:hypothetical protein